MLLINLLNLVPSVGTAPLPLSLLLLSLLSLSKLRLLFRPFVLVLLLWWMPRWRDGGALWLPSAVEVTQYAGVRSGASLLLLLVSDCCFGVALIAAAVASLRYHPQDDHRQGRQSKLCL